MYLVYREKAPVLLQAIGSRFLWFSTRDHGKIFVFPTTRWSEGGKKRFLATA
jgi:hypothetical protein